jgi:hypothetical protein
MNQQPDRVRQYLRRLGCTPTVVKGGLEGLISHWESLVEGVAEGYDLTLADYLADMDLRDVLQGALEFAADDDREQAEKRVRQLDETFRELTEECEPVHGAAEAEANGHDPRLQWWFFRRPLEPSPDFEEELREAGLV